MGVEDKHMQKLKDLIKEEVTFMFEQALDFAQVASKASNCTFIISDASTISQ